VATPRVFFLHGLEGSPQGRKSRALGARFECVAPALPTADFEASVACTREALRAADPDIVVGSSFGGAIALALLQRGFWCGPTLLLAPAGASQGLQQTLPPGDARVVIVHALGDDLVPVEDSRALARTGDPDRVRLVEVEDDHALGAFVESGRLVALVEEVYAETRNGASVRAALETRSIDEHAQRPTIAAPRADAPSGIDDGSRFRIETFFEDPGLLPVTMVALAIVVLGGAVLLLGALRAHNPPIIAALLLVLAMTVDIARRRPRPGRAFAWIGGLLVLSGIVAWIADHSGLL
jgi:pimeloyl-ACP methyl ester carboxylesterase